MAEQLAELNKGGENKTGIVTLSNTIISSGSSATVSGINNYDAIIVRTYCGGLVQSQIIPKGDTTAHGSSHYYTSGYHGDVHVTVNWTNSTITVTKDNVAGWTQASDFSVRATYGVNFA